MKRLLISFITTGILFFAYNTSDSYAQQALLSIDPATQTVAAGSTFQVQVKLGTGTQSINTVVANLTYDGEVITPQSVDVTGSFISIWFENSINTSGEVIRLSGSIPSPGINGENLHFATITFSADAVATTQIQFDSDSAVFRDSDNTNILNLAGSTGGIVSVSADLTPEPSANPTNTTPVPTNATITPTRLPDAGTTLPTQILILFALLLAVGAALLLL